MERIVKYFKRPKLLIPRLLPCLPISDKVYLKIWYKSLYGERLELEHPKTYNEKLQWLKLYNRQPLYTKLVDKYAVKEIVKDLIGEEYVIPLINVYKTPEDIDFDELPNQFVLKATHGGGSFGVIVCKDKAKLNKDAAITTLKYAMKTDGSKRNKEWVYKNVPKQIIAENYMEDCKTKELRDYKFFCFNGEPRLLFVATGRGSQPEPHFDWFDMDYNHLKLKTGHPNSPIDKLPEKPETFEEMKKIAAKLSEGIPHVRIDLYECNGKAYFGEFTFFHWSGINKFEPEEWNIKMGEWIQLPDVKTF